MSEALEIAVAVSRVPPLGVRLHAQALPGDVLDVIRVAAGDRIATEQGVSTTGFDADALREAATHYLQLALFCEHADSYRTLGLMPDASSMRLKEHYRWLMHWLHPDRDRAADLSVFSERVNRAWNDLRTPSRREAYDQFLKHRNAAAEMAEPMPWGEGEIFERTPRAERMFARWLSGRAVRRLPAIVVGTLGVVVGALVIALLTLRTPNENEADLTAVDAPAPTVAPAGPPATSAVPTPDAAQTAASTPAPSTEMARNDAVPAEKPPLETAPAAANLAARAGSDANANVQGSPKDSAAVTAAESTAEPARETPRPSAPPASAPPLLAAAQTGASGVSVLPRRAPSATEQAVAAPVAAPEPAAGHPATHSPKADPIARAASVPTPAQAQSTLEHMQNAYRQGDLGAMMALFASDLSDPPRSEVTTQYADLFRSSSERSLVLRNVAWIVHHDTAVGLGEYQTIVIAHPKAPPRIASGTIRVELRMEDGEPRIVRMRHDRLSGS